MGHRRGHPVGGARGGAGGVVRARRRGCGWLHGVAAGGDRARRRDVRRRRAAVALPGAPLGDRRRQAVYTRSGWLVQERRIAPISRVQTVDTHRGPLDRLFGLANVTVTTASSAGAVRIVALDSDVADRIVGAADRHRRDRRPGRDVTAPAQWRRLSPRMLLVHPVHEVLRQLPLLIGSVVLGSATGNPLWSIAALGAAWSCSASRGGSPPPTGSTPSRSSGARACCSARCCRCRATGFGRCPPTRGCCTGCSG